MRVLVVTSPFGGRQIGERIADEDEIDEVLGGEHAHHVVAADHDAGSEDSESAPQGRESGSKNDEPEDDSTQEN